MNIFREALEILNTKRGDEMSEEELKLIATAELPFLTRNCPYLRDMLVRECLETLAQIVEGDGDA